MIDNSLIGFHPDKIHGSHAYSNEYYNTSVKTSGRCITQLAEMTIDPNRTDSHLTRLERFYEKKKYRKTIMTAFRRFCVINPFTVPKCLPILSSSNFVPKKGFQLYRHAQRSPVIQNAKQQKSAIPFSYHGNGALSGVWVRQRHQVPHTPHHILLIFFFGGGRDKRGEEATDGD